MGQTLGPTIGGILGQHDRLPRLVPRDGQHQPRGRHAGGDLRQGAAAGARGTAQARKRASLREMLRSRPLAILFGDVLLDLGRQHALAADLAAPAPGDRPDHDVAFTAGLAFSVLGVSGAIASVLSSAERRPVRLAAAGRRLRRLVAASSHLRRRAGDDADDGAGGAVRRRAGAGHAGFVLDGADQPVRAGQPPGHGVRHSDVGPIAGDGDRAADRRGARVGLGPAGAVRARRALLLLAGGLLVLAVPRPPTTSDLEVGACMSARATDSRC